MRDMTRSGREQFREAGDRKYIDNLRGEVKRLEREVEQRGRDIGILATKNEELEAEAERLREQVKGYHSNWRKAEAEVERLRDRIAELEARNLYLRSLVEDDEEGPVEEKHRLEREVEGNARG